MNFDYSYSSITLKDACDIEPTLLDVFVLDTTEQTEKFKAIFRAKYNIYDIGAETIELFKRFITDRFNEYKEYYQQLLNEYYKELNYMDGIVINISYSDDTNSEARNIDLPNRSTTGEYVSDKRQTNGNTSYTKTTRGNEDVLELRNNYLKYIRNLYSEFSDKFKDCFSLIYG